MSVDVSPIDDAFGGAVEIMSCEVDNREIAPGRPAIVSVQTEANLTEELLVAPNWHDADGVGVVTEAEMHPGGNEIVAEIDHATAMEVWGSGRVFLQFTLRLQQGEDAEPGVTGTPNEPVPCGAVTVVES